MSEEEQQSQDGDKCTISMQNPMYASHEGATRMRQPQSYWRSLANAVGKILNNSMYASSSAVPIGKYCAGADVLRESAGRCAGLPSGECGTSSGRVRYVLRESAVRPAGECGTFCGSQTFCSSLLEQRKLEVNDLRPACKQDWTGSGCNIKGAGGFC
ncbi:hypothetical protein Bbelb_053840 [Branchiostoma belcheri]|nr:hypothetical protein Bbelb_053840 [Branchiostoma belcheri]